MSDAMFEMISQLKPFSIGIVLVDKPNDTNDISVFPTEQLFSTEGVISKADATIEAMWLPLGNFNRRTAPDVCKGQTVQIYRYADTDKYYWTTLFNEIGLQKLEHAVYSWSGVPASSKEASDSDNSYWLMVSPRDGKIHLHTSESNSEPVTYDISIDTKQGTFMLTDSKDNTILLNSLNGTLIADISKSITLKAADRITLVAKDIITSSERVTLRASEYVSSDTPVTKTGNMVIDGNIDQRGSIESTGYHKADAHL